MNTRNQERVGTDTETILQQLTKMKEDIIQDRVEKDQAMMDKINEKLDSFNETLSESIRVHGERLTELEGAKTSHDTELNKLKTGLEKLQDENNTLKDLIVDSVQHSRRLNLDFMGFAEVGRGENEDQDVVIAKIRNFLYETLKIDDERVGSILFRTAHRLGKYDASKNYPRIIKAGFVCMSDRDLILSRAYKCKDTPYSIRVDVCPQIAPLRKLNLDTRKRILEINPTALASCTYRNVNHPVLLVKYKGKVQQYNASTMDIAKLEKADKKPRSD